MIKMILSGVNGAMGHVLQDVIGAAPDCQIVAGFDLKDNGDTSFPVYTTYDQCQIGRAHV